MGQTQNQGRVLQLWMPLITIAFKFNDWEWLSYAGANIGSDAEEQSLGRQYEDDEAVAGSLEICRKNATRLYEHWIKISDIKRTANMEFEKTLKPEQVAAILLRRGHRVSTIDGYPVVWVK